MEQIALEIVEASKAATGQTEVFECRSIDNCQDNPTFECVLNATTLKHHERYSSFETTLSFHAIGGDPEDFIRQIRESKWCFHGRLSCLRAIGGGLSSALLLQSSCGL